MHLARGVVLARGALRCRPLRAARPRILDPRHWCGGLGRGGFRWSFLVPTRFAVWLSIWLAIAATVIAATMIAGAVAIVPALAAIACAGGSLILGSCRRLAHP